MIKKKKKGKSYSDQVKPKSKSKTPKLKSSSNNVKDARKEKGKELMRKLIGEPKNTKAEKVVGKKTKAKPMGTAAKKAAGKKALKKIPKKSDKRIEGSGSQSARPKGSIGKTRTADSPRGGTTGISMKDARKKQMRDTANLGSEMKRLGRKYDDLPKGVKRTILMAIKSKDPAKIKKAMRGTNMTASEFVKVFNKRGKM